MKGPRLSQGNIFKKSSCSSVYLVGHTPIDNILYIDQHCPNADITGAKYSKHQAGDKRSGDAKPDNQTRITIVLRGGPWKQQMWLDDGKRAEIELSQEGDYIAWEPGYYHTWEAIGDATMLTISFRRRN